MMKNFYENISMHFSIPTLYKYTLVFIELQLLVFEFPKIQDGVCNVCKLPKIIIIVSCQIHLISLLHFDIPN